MCRNLSDGGVADTAGPALTEPAANGTSAAAAAATSQHDSISALLDMELDPEASQAAAARLGDSLSNLLSGTAFPPPTAQQQQV